MGAVTASRRNPALKAFRDRLLANGKPRKVALIAVARKLLTSLRRCGSAATLNAIVRTQQPWHAHSA
jgi:transposase